MQSQLTIIGIGAFFAAFTTQAQTWFPHESGTTKNLYDTDRYGSVVVGESGTILRVLIGSIPIDDVPPSVTIQADSSGTVHDLYAVDCINTCFAVGDSGTILHGGSSGDWVTIPSGTNKALRSVYFQWDGDSGFVAGDSGMILMKTGEMWEQKPSGVTQNLHHIGFQLNYWSGSGRTDTGYAVGAAGTIIKTTDRGESWVPLVSATTHDLHSGRFPVNPEALFVVGDSGTILRSTDRGQTWNQIPSGTSKALYSIHFRTRSHGVVAGEGGVILSTSDSGHTWSSQSSETTHDLYAIRSYEGMEGGVAFGGSGTLLVKDLPTSIGRIAKPALRQAASGYHVDPLGRKLDATSSKRGLPALSVPLRRE